MENFDGNGTINQNSTTERPVLVDELIWYYLPLVVIAPLAVPPNALVIRLLLGKLGICSTSEIFILNLALFDTLACFLILVEFIRLVCLRTMEAASFVAWGLNQAGGPMLLSLLSLDSYVAVCHPLVFLRLKDPKLRLSVCFVVSAMTAGCCSLMKEASRSRWYMILGVLSWAIVIISTCNILILKSLHQSGPGRKEVHPVKKRAFKTVLTILVLVNIHYLPPLTEFLVRTFGPSYFSPWSVFSCVAYTALSMSSFVQPLCYLVRTNQLPNLRCNRGSAAQAKTVASV